MVELLAAECSAMLYHPQSSARLGFEFSTVLGCESWHRVGTEGDLIAQVPCGMRWCGWREVYRLWDVCNVGTRYLLGIREFQ